MLLRVLLVTLQQQCQEYEREILNYIKSIARECMLGSPYILQVSIVQTQVAESSESITL